AEEGSFKRFGLSWLDANSGQQAFMKDHMSEYLQYRPSEITSLRTRWIAEGGPPWYLGLGMENSYEYGERREKRFLKYLKDKGMKVGKTGAIADVIARDVKIKAQQAKTKVQQIAKAVKEKAGEYISAAQKAANLRGLQLLAWGADKGIWISGKLSEVRIKGKWFDTKNLDTGKYEKKLKELKEKSEAGIKQIKLDEKVKMERAAALAQYGAEGGEWDNGKLKRVKVMGRWIEIKDATKITSLTEKEREEIRKWRKTHIPSGVRPKSKKEAQTLQDKFIYNKLGEVVGVKEIGAEGVTTSKDLAGREARNRMTEAATTGKIIDKTNKKLTAAMSKDQKGTMNAMVQNISNTVNSSNSNSQSRAVVGGGGGGGTSGTASSGGSSVVTVLHCNQE
ncbi:MAG TPA: hypothetical protein VMV86_03690, partial [Methanosarcinales archaeon]|nr:hypothetical protein [Methanosarcinales archaeon]